MNLIVAVSSNWGIGNNNDLLFRIREDLIRFKNITTGKVVVMGHNTYKSLGKPLPNRVNIVLSRNTSLEIPGVVICDSIQALEQQITEDAFVIGGEQIYRQLLHKCKFAFVTKVNAAPPANVFMPNLDELPQWKLVEESPINIFGNLEYSYCMYSRNEEVFDEQ